MNNETKEVFNDKQREKYVGELLYIVRDLPPEKTEQLFGGLVNVINKQDLTWIYDFLLKYENIRDSIKKFYKGKKDNFSLLEYIIDTHKDVELNRESLNEYLKNNATNINPNVVSAYYKVLNNDEKRLFDLLINSGKDPKKVIYLFSNNVSLNDIQKVKYVNDSDIIELAKLLSNKGTIILDKHISEKTLKRFYDIVWYSDKYRIIKKDNSYFIYNTKKLLVNKVDDVKLFTYNNSKDVLCKIKGNYYIIYKENSKAKKVIDYLQYKKDVALLVKDKSNFDLLVISNNKMKKIEENVKNIGLIAFDKSGVDYYIKDTKLKEYRFTSNRKKRILVNLTIKEIEKNGGYIFKEKGGSLIILNNKNKHRAKINSNGIFEYEFINNEIIRINSNKKSWYFNSNLEEIIEKPMLSDEKIWIKGKDNIYVIKNKDTNPKIIKYDVNKKAYKEYKISGKVIRVKNDKNLIQIISRVNDGTKLIYSLNNKLKKAKVIYESNDVIIGLNNGRYTVYNKNVQKLNKKKVGNLFLVYNTNNYLILKNDKIVDLSKKINNPEQIKGNIKRYGKLYVVKDLDMILDEELNEVLTANKIYSVFQESNSLFTVYKDKGKNKFAEINTKNEQIQSYDLVRYILSKEGEQYIFYRTDIINNMLLISRGDNHIKTRIQKELTNGRIIELNKRVRYIKANNRNDGIIITLEPKFRKIEDVTEIVNNKAYTILKHTKSNKYLMFKHNEDNFLIFDDIKFDNNIFVCYKGKQKYIIKNTATSI